MAERVWWWPKTNSEVEAVVSRARVYEEDAIHRGLLLFTLIAIGFAFSLLVALQFAVLMLVIGKDISKMSQGAVGLTIMIGCVFTLLINHFNKDFLRSPAEVFIRIPLTSNTKKDFESDFHVRI